MQAKKALSLASLVAAVPAGLLTYFLVMVILKSSEKMPPVMLFAIVPLTLLSCAALLFIPVAALVFGGRKSARRESAVASDEAEASAGSMTAEPVEEAIEGELEVAEASLSDETMEIEDAEMTEDFDDFETFDDLDDDK